MRRFAGGVVGSVAALGLAAAWTLLSALHGGGTAPSAVATELADAAPATPAPPDSTPSLWMTVKLEKSESVLGALARGDFATLASDAETLATLNEAEGFVRRRNPSYRTQLRIFQYAVEELRRQAMRENLEGAALAFNQLTLSCVHCHRDLRDQAPEPAPTGPAPSLAPNPSPP
jgi:hypothetical protein